MHLLFKDSRAWIFLSAFTSLLLIATILITLKNPVSIDDGLRHYAFGKLMMEQGIFSAQWSQFLDHGYLSSHDTDPWFLSNVLFGILSPLGPVLTPKVFAFLSVAALLAVFLWIFRTLNTPPKIAGVLLFMLIFFDPMFYVRLLLGRPYELVTVLTVLALFSAMRGKMFLLTLSIIFSVLLSQLFVFPVAITLSVIFWRLHLGDYSSARRLFFTFALSMLLGVALHPHPVAYIIYIREAFLHIPFLPYVQLGMEMQSSLVTVLRVWLVLGFSLLLSVGFLWLEQDGYERFHRRGLSLLALLALLYSSAFFRWSRMIDIAWPIVILFLTVLLSESPSLLQKVSHRIFLPALRSFKGILLALLLGICFLTWIGTTSILISFDDTRSLKQYEVGLQSIPPGAHILNVDWHLFAPMVAVRPDLHFAAGIDPSYTYLTDPEVHRLLAMLKDPEFGSASKEPKPEAWLQALLSQYPSEYFVIERARHTSLITSLVALGFVDDAPEEILAVFRTGKFTVQR